MGSIPYAFSVHHFINSVGADAGFAAIIGLAVLVLLYFAQARETANLREQAHEAAQRTQQLEARLAQLSRQGAAVPVAEAPAPAAASGAGAGAAAGNSGSRVAAVPAAAASASVPAGGTGVWAPVTVGAPAGVGAPALTAATKLIPEVRAPATAAAPATATAGIGAAAAGVGTAERPLEATSVGGPPPATVAGGAANGAASPVSSPPEPVQGPPPARGQTPPPQRGQTLPPRPGVRPGASGPGARRPATAPRAAAPQPSSRGRRIAIAGLVILVAAAAVGALLLLTSSGGGSTASTSASNSTRASNAPVAHHHRSSGSAAAAGAGAVNPSTVTVSVLNGTATTGLAARVSQKLSGGGYKQGTVATATDQTRTATTVAYLPGDKRDATAVAAALKLGPASVSPIDANTQAVACPPPAACTSAVVVTVGSDLATTQ